MGFRPEETELKITFPGSRLAGLELRMRSVTVREFSQMMADTAKTGAEAVAAQERLLALFADRLISWDLEHPKTGEPVPPTREGIDTLDSNLMTELILGWQRALTSVPPTSPGASQNGATPSHTAESTLGLDAASQSLGS